MVYSSGACNKRCTVDEHIIERYDLHDTNTYTSPTNHVIVLKCSNASKPGRQAYTSCFVIAQEKAKVNLWSVNGEDFPSQSKPSISSPCLRSSSTTEHSKKFAYFAQVLEKNLIHSALLRPLQLTLETFHILPGF